jgi:hypothetical protein
MALLEDGEERLKFNREKSLGFFRKRFATYLKDGDFSVTPESQKELNLE